MRISLSPRFVRHYAQMSKNDQKACDDAVDALAVAFGHPHKRAGLGLRALRRGVYECRAIRAVRIGFTRHGDVLLLQTVGNHETISSWLKGV